MGLTSAELIILGLIIEAPQHGYDLEGVIEQRGIRQWTDVGFSSIYYLMTKLEKRGLLAVPEAPSTSRSRRVYHATDAGRRAATDSTMAHLVEPRPVPHPLLSGLANLLLLSESEYADALGRRLEQTEARIAAVEEQQRSQTPLPLPASEVFSYSLAQLEAERTWLAARVQTAND